MMESLTKKGQEVWSNVSLTAWSLCFTEEANDKLHKNTHWLHTYHKDCLQAYVKTKLDQMQFPFRCPVRSCTRPLSRITIGESIDSPEDSIKLDNLNFINRVEKGKRMILWWVPWKEIFTLQRHEDCKWYICKGKVYRVKTILEQKDKNSEKQGNFA